ncbi:HYR domain-containing protein [Lutibacter sp. TH_r2]|uniref:HYR domain-containing protein n=1 Tax=Lutibacter sp. TH_r2 TaxID=3082083 RepID=UPI002953D226|nr:HYR domain-containing protein [Lutibacter sp. TH_r2]MDV7186400.1 HYR domain-containing protein [Lutibacter sp. TH_r2]
MLKIQFYYLYAIVLFVVIACGGSSDESEEIIEQLDNENPVIVCVDPINIFIEANENGSIVNYTTPVGTDNLSGVVTEQTAGLPSGDVFPVGTTTNTFLATDKAGNSTSCSFDITIERNAPSSDSPYFIEDNNPLPTGKKWVKVEGLTDEFNENALDEVKWKNTDPSKWIGRAPGLFKKNTVSQAEGNLQLTANILSEPEVVNDVTFTHEGSNITSNTAAEVGYYFECRMKANKTFMSSTFWLINVRNEGEGCDVRTTELDIQECVGQITSTDSWAQTTDRHMGYHMHSRNTTCTETPTGTVGGDTLIGGIASEDYHVYAAWWKSSTEVQFFLDGKKVYSGSPEAEFNLKMYLRMVVETYDWNPVPDDGGMTGSEEDRTTYYDWVRTWKLEDE